MELSSIQGSSGIPSLVGSPAGTTGGNGFSRVLTGVLGEAAGKQTQAEQAVQSLALGQAENLHGVMLKMAQADLSFQFVLQVRNRLLDAYQQVMQMTV